MSNLMNFKHVCEYHQSTDDIRYQHSLSSFDNHRTGKVISRVILRFINYSHERILSSAINTMIDQESRSGDLLFQAQKYVIPTCGSVL